MRLTQHVDYGLRVLMYLASRPGEYATSAELAKVFGVSHNHLLKVVHRLCELGYVDAKRGPSGGVCFLPSTGDVTVGEVVRRLEPPHALVECFDPAINTCPMTGLCGLAPLLRRASEAFLRELDRTTLREIATPATALLARSRPAVIGRSLSQPGAAAERRGRRPRSTADRRRAGARGRSRQPVSRS